MSRVSDSLTTTRASACAVAALLVAACSQPVKAPEPLPVEVPLLEPTVTWTRPEPAPITIAVVGDIMMGTDFPLNHLPDDDGESFFSGVEHILSSSDVTFGNLEGVLLDGGEPVKECKDPSACYLFRTPTRYANYLRDAGFDVLSLANNHALDFGEAGRSVTMETLEQLGMFHSGRLDDVASWKTKGRRVAMIAFSPTRGSHSLLDIEEAALRVAQLAAGHDIVLVSFHGGAEGIDATRLSFGEEFYYGESRGEVVKFARRMIDAGADLLIGHGPHVPRAMEIYKDRLIIYSLGNFATYYGISVAGIKGIAPIVTSTLEKDGRFIGGTIASTIQIRPGGPQVDAEQRAERLIMRLTIEDFGPDEILFIGDGRFLPPQ